jgi:histidine triad (HIT) family protein
MGSSAQDIVFKDNLVTCFVAGRFLKNNPGHIIVIPNKHIENIYDLPKEFGYAIYNASKKAAIALKESYKCEGVSTRQHNEPAGNQEVWHYHLHVIPRYKDDQIYRKEDTYIPDAEEKKSYVDKLKLLF